MFSITQAATKNILRCYFFPRNYDILLTKYVRTQKEDAWVQDRFVTAMQKQGIAIEQMVPMHRHTSFQIGGAARYVAHVEGQQFAALFAEIRAAELRYFVLGNGSNLLVDDRGFEGVIVCLREEAAQVHGQDICAPAGLRLSRLALCAAQHSLGGLAFAGGIPGTVGGGVFMNAGAYGGELAQTLVHSRYFDTEQPHSGVQTLPAAQHQFAYRYSIFRAQRHWILLDSTFTLHAQPRAEIEEEMARYAAARREKQPLNLPSAGSSYKRPPGHFAGKLIEDAGLKGFAVGGAQVSPKHAGFIVNTGGATCRDVLALMEEIEARVYAQFGVQLTREVEYLPYDGGYFCK